MTAMPAVTSGRLDNKKAIDVVKYAMIMGDPLNPGKTPPWLSGLLAGKPPTMRNKLSAVTANGVTKKWIDDNKVQVDHPELKTYQRIVQRVRACVGFSAWDELHKKIWQEMCRRGMGHKQCPLTSALLLDPQIFTSDAFSTKADKENVPLWRDRENATTIQQGMIDVAATRLFEYGFLDMKSVKSLFPSGAAWTAFARLMGPPHHHVHQVLLTEFGPQTSWPDSAVALHKSVWSGEYDQEMSKMSSLLPSTLDGQPQQMQARVKELFAPVQQLLHARMTEAHRMSQTQAEREAAAKKQAEEEAKANAAAEKSDVHDVLAVKEDGDVTDDLCPQADPAAKKKLCDQMNASAKTK